MPGGVCGVSLTNGQGDEQVELYMAKVGPGGWNLSTIPLQKGRGPQINITGNSSEPKPPPETTGSAS